MRNLSEINLIWRLIDGSNSQRDDFPRRSFEQVNPDRVKTRYYQFFEHCDETIHTASIRFYYSSYNYIMKIERERKIEYNMDGNTTFNKIVSNCLHYTEKRNSFSQEQAT